MQFGEKDQKSSFFEKHPFILIYFLFYFLHEWLFTLFNPIPAEVLENQDMLGGGQFDPPL